MSKKSFMWGVNKELNIGLNHLPKEQQPVKNRLMSVSKKEEKLLRDIWIKFEEKENKILKTFEILFSSNDITWIDGKKMLSWMNLKF